MKANEAPEEIYLLPDDKNPNGLSICWYDAPYRTGAIEYTRTDAFIEKAVQFFEDHFTEENCKFGISEWTEVKSDFKSLDSFIRAFKNYMKGE